MIEARKGQDLKGLGSREHGCCPTIDPEKMEGSCLKYSSGLRLIIHYMTLTLHLHARDRDTLLLHMHRGYSVQYLTILLQGVDPHTPFISRRIRGVLSYSVGFIDSFGYNIIAYVRSMLMAKVPRIRCLSRKWEKRLKKAWRSKVRRLGKRECRDGS